MIWFSSPQTQGQVSAYGNCDPDGEAPPRLSQRGAIWAGEKEEENENKSKKEEKKEIITALPSPNHRNAFIFFSVCIDMQ